MSIDAVKLLPLILSTLMYLLLTTGPLQHNSLLAVILLSQMPILSRLTSSLSTHWKTTYVSVGQWIGYLAMVPRQRYPIESKTYFDTTPLMTGRVNHTTNTRTRLNADGESSNLWLTWC